MDPIRPSLASPRSYEDFVPPSDWIREEGFDMLLMELPGFRKDHLKVQLDNFGNLRTFGECPLDGNRYRRFRKEFRLPDNCNTSEIRAKFEDGILTVTIPKPTTKHAEPAIPAAPSPARAELPATAEPPPPRDAPAFPASPPSARAESPATAKPPPPPPRDEPTFTAPPPARAELPATAKPPPPARAELPATTKPPPPRDAPTFPAPPPPPPKDEATFVTPPPPTKTTPESQTMPKPSEATKELNDSGKVEEKTMEAMREEEANYEAEGLAVGLKRKRKQLVVNIVVAAVLLVGVGSYVAMNRERFRVQYTQVIIQGHKGTNSGQDHTALLYQ